MMAGAPFQRVGLRGWRQSRPGGCLDPLDLWAWPPAHGSAR